MVSWYLTTNHKVPTLSRRHTLGVPHIKYVVDLSTLGTVPHSVQYHTSWDTHYICGQVGHTWCSTTLPHGRVWPQRPIVDTVIIITWVSEQDDRTSLAHSTDLVSDDWITFGQCWKRVTQILYGIRYHKRARAHSPLVDRARGDKRLRPWWHIGGGGGGEGTPVIKAASLLPATIRLLGKSLKWSTYGALVLLRFSFSKSFHYTDAGL